MRKHRHRQCIICGEKIHPLLGSFLCLTHAIQKRERTREKTGRKARYNSLTYRLEQQMKKKEACCGKQ